MQSHQELCCTIRLKQTDEQAPNADISNVLLYYQADTLIVVLHKSTYPAYCKIKDTKSRTHAVSKQRKSCFHWALNKACMQDCTTTKLHVGLLGRGLLACIPLHATFKQTIQCDVWMYTEHKAQLLRTQYLMDASEAVACRPLLHAVFRQFLVPWLCVQTRTPRGCIVSAYMCASKAEGLLLASRCMQSSMSCAIACGHSFGTSGTRMAPLMGISWVTICAASPDMALQDLFNLRIRQNSDHARLEEFYSGGCWYGVCTKTGACWHRNMDPMQPRVQQCRVTDVACKHAGQML